MPRDSAVVQHSATLALDERVRARRAAGEDVVHLGFGEAGLPVLAQVTEVLAGAAGRNEYGAVAGSPQARHAAAGYLTRRGLPTEPADVVLAPGSKALLYALLAVLPGDLVLPRPSWVSYAAQAALTGKRVLGVPIPQQAGGVPDPALLDDALTRARRDGAEPGVLILTLPDNPTGTLADADLVAQVCAVADAHRLTVVSDEIYRDLVHSASGPRPATVHSPAHHLPERTIVTAGLSKSMALGGYRIGFARIPRPDIRAAVIGVASEVWSSLPAPMQEVAAYVLDEPPEVRDHIAASRRLHGAVACAMHETFTAAGAHCRPPRAGFYLYPDLEPLRAHGFATGAELAGHLLDRHGIGVLAGAAFGDDPSALRFRVATSLLYGEDTEQRSCALTSADPVALPWIRASLARVRDALTAVFQGE